MAPPLGHMVTRLVQAPADIALAFLSDPVSLGRWSLGCFGTMLDETSGAHTGRSLFDGSQGWFSIEVDHPRMIIDYLVGAPDRLSRRISARVVAGATVGYDEGSCLVMLSAWRPAEMDDERWEQLCASHEAEIWLIKAQIETYHRECRGDEG